jgi:Family of unknown function (DUF5995)
MIRRQHGLSAFVLFVVALLLSSTGGTIAATAPAGFVGWPTDLPAWAYQFNPSSPDDCSAGRPACVKQTIKTMNLRFTPLATSCHHNAVFSLAYLRTTQEYARFAAERPSHFDDVAWVNHEDAVFAQFYFKAYDAWVAGRTADVPQAWEIAFDAAQNKQVSAAGDLLLGMSAHVNRDLPFVLAGLGLVAPNGQSREHDHFVINEMLQRVVQPLMAEEAKRFDPTIDDANDPLGITYSTLFEMLKAWRANAWQNAKNLVQANTPTAQAAVARSIETQAVASAQTLVTTFSYTPPVTTTAARDAWCATHHG